MNKTKAIVVIDWTLRGFLEGQVQGLGLNI